jgi:C1A family cysteine protease
MFILNIMTHFLYRVGIYNDGACDNKGVNHGVVVVGWGTRKLPFIGFPFPYWIVRNSWGSTWGSGGYILMQRGVNKCNIERYPATIVSVV